MVSPEEAPGYLLVGDGANVLTEVVVHTALEPSATIDIEERSSIAVLKGDCYPFDGNIPKGGNTRAHGIIAECNSSRVKSSKISNSQTRGQTERVGCGSSDVAQSANLKLVVNPEAEVIRWWWG